MTHSDIRLDLRDAVAVVRLARPAKRNAISDEVILGIRSVFEQMPQVVRAIVLDGEGDHFCAGLDLSELKARPIYFVAEHTEKQDETEIRPSSDERTAAE